MLTIQLSNFPQNQRDNLEWYTLSNHTYCPITGQDSGLIFSSNIGYVYKPSKVNKYY